MVDGWIWHDCGTRRRKAAGDTAEPRFRYLRHTGNPGLYVRGRHTGTDEADGAQRLSRRGDPPAPDQ
ncbi:integrase [Streptomyces azureus]|uniref:Integrase n=1 Tax=Streptomyces azureus TaxID=146537 RepID=A0A0K8PYD9_STRAJ|nr:integrase [Streptomyces azureus]